MGIKCYKDYREKWKKSNQKDILLLIRKVGFIKPLYNISHLIRCDRMWCSIEFDSWDDSHSLDKLFRHGARRDRNHLILSSMSDKNSFLDIFFRLIRLSRKLREDTTRKSDDATDFPRSMIECIVRQNRSLTKSHEKNIIICNTIIRMNLINACHYLCKSSLNITDIIERLPGGKINRIPSISS